MDPINDDIISVYVNMYSAFFLLLPGLKMGVESYNFCLNYGYHLDNWVAHPHQGGLVEFLLADFNQLRVILLWQL